MEVAIRELLAQLQFTLGQVQASIGEIAVAVGAAQKGPKDPLLTPEGTFDSSRVYSVTEIARATGLSRQTIYNAKKSGRLVAMPSPRGVKATRFSGEALNAWRPRAAS